MKKTLSILLTLLLIFSTVAPSTYAIESIPTIEATEDSLMVMPTSLSDGQIWAGKSVDYNTNGEFDVTLKAIGQNYTFEKPIPQEQLDVVMILDTSGSMGKDANGNDNPKKLNDMKTAAKLAASTFLKVEGNKVAIITYSDLANVKQTLTNSESTLTGSIDLITKAEGGTNIQNAFLKAENLLNARTDTTRKSVVILMSDGQPTYYYTEYTTHSNRIGTGYSNETTGAYVWNTIVQAQQLKDNVAGSVIYTIGFGVGENAYAKATLQPTKDNTATMRPTYEQYQKRDRTETARYIFESHRTWFLGWSGWTNWEKTNDKTNINTTYTDWINSSASESSWEEPVLTGDILGIALTTDIIGYEQKTGYKLGSRIGTEYRKTDIATDFAQKYWEVGSSFSSTSTADIIDAFVKIATELTNQKPNTIGEVDTYSDVVITDVIGDAFELVGTPEGFAYDATTKTVTWTIPGDSFKSMVAGSTAIDTSAVQSLSFKVKLKDKTAAGKYYTNKNAGYSFDVLKENPNYEAIGEITESIENTGSITLVLPAPVVGKVIIKHEKVDGSEFNVDTFTTGNVGENYTASPIKSDTHTATLKIESAPATGLFTAADITVTYVYTPIPGKVIIKHVNVDDTEFNVNTFTTGNVGENYTASPVKSDTHTAALKIGSAPATGLFTAADITVTYVYTPIPPTMFSLTVTTEGNGSVTPNSGAFEKNSKVTVTAVPAQGWEFSHWTGALTSSNEEENLVMDANKAIHAVFTEIPVYYGLTTHTVGSGSINVTPTAESYLKDSSVELDAVPEEGWRFVDWTGDVTGTSSHRTLKMDGAKTVTATFVKIDSDPVNQAPVVTSTFVNGTSLEFGSNYDFTVSVYDFENTLGTKLYSYLDSNSPTPSWFFIEGPNGVVKSMQLSPLEGSIALGAHTLTYFAIDASGAQSAPLTLTFTVTTKDIPVEEPEVPTTTEPQQPVQPQGPTGNVKVDFVDTLGNTIAPSFTFSGEIGTNYSTTARIVTGYTLVETPANASGSFTEANTDVAYVYSNDTEVITEEDVAEGDAKITNFDSFDQSVPETTTLEEVEIATEATPLADALPQTGQLPVELFYGIGGLITAAGVFLKKKN